MTVKELLQQLIEERKALMEEEFECDKREAECLKINDQNSAAKWAYRSRVLFAQERDIDTAICIIKERAT